MTADEENALYARVQNYLSEVIAIYHTARPGLKVLVSGYDYARLFSENDNISNYQEIYERAGKPTVLEMHSAALRFAAATAGIANFKNTFYIHHHGIMHWYRGNSDHGLAPYQTLPPEQISPPENPMAFGGIPALELDRKAMFRVFGLVDSYHLSPSSWILLADHSVQHYLRKWFPKSNTSFGGGYGRE
jgi:hypothetical protein